MSNIQKCVEMKVIYIILVWNLMGNTIVIVFLGCEIFVLERES